MRYKINQVKNPDNPRDNGNNNRIQKITPLGNNFFLWYLKYILDTKHINDSEKYYNYGDIKTNGTKLLVGANFMDGMTRYNLTRQIID